MPVSEYFVFTFDQCIHIAQSVWAAGAKQSTPIPARRTYVYWLAFALGESVFLSQPVPPFHVLAPATDFRFPNTSIPPQFPGYQWWPKVNGDPQAQILSLAHSHCHSHSQSQSQSGCLSAAGSGALQICQYCECSGLNRVINCAKWIWIILHWEANKITQQNNEKKKRRKIASGLEDELVTPHIVPYTPWTKGGVAWLLW